MLFCGCNGSGGSGQSAKKEASLRFLRKELLYDIRQYAYVEGDVSVDTEGELHHHRHQTQDVAQEGNVDIVTRRLDSAFEECVALLQPIARVDMEDGEEIDDRLVPRSEYVVSLSVPEGFSRTALGLLAKKMHDYMVFRTLALWFSVTAPSASAKYGLLGDEAAEYIKDARFAGGGGVLRPLYPF